MSGLIEGAGFAATARCPIPKGARLHWSWRGDKRRAEAEAAKYIRTTGIHIGTRTVRVNIEWRYDAADPYRRPTPGATANSALADLAAVLGIVYRGRSWTDPLPEPYSVTVRSLPSPTGGAP